MELSKIGSFWVPNFLWGRYQKYLFVVFYSTKTDTVACRCRHGAAKNIYVWLRKTTSNKRT